MTPSLAPVYQYISVDLMSNRVLGEIPFRNVSWERTLNGAGQFSGKISVIEKTKHLSLYETTMPGQTALYVLRNGVCVWGGIIWAREYDGKPDSNELTVSASEFSSYLYHRRIWKTWGHQFGGTVTQENGSWVVVLDAGSSVLAKPGSTVRLEYYEPSNFKYNGYYRVANSPAPNSKKFYLTGGAAVADIKSYSVDQSWVTLYTKEAHGYTTGDSINISITQDADPGFALGTGYKRDHVVDIPQGSTNVIRFLRPVGISQTTLRPVEGTTSRPIPTGTYEDVTVTVRLDAFDYVRSLLDSVATDFVGTDFPNVYIEPGISYPIEVDTKSAVAGTAIVGTSEPHGLSVGQAVQIQDVDRMLDGEWEIAEVISPTAFSYHGVGGTLPLQDVTTQRYKITRLSMVEGVATFTTDAPHTLAVGNTVTIDMGEPYSSLSGSYKVSAVPNGSTFKVVNGSLTAIPTTDIPLATAQVPGRPVNAVTAVGVDKGKVTVQLKDPVQFSVGNTVTLSGVSRSLQVIEKTYDAPNSRATIQTAQPHGLRVDDTIKLTGLRDTVTVIAKDSSTTRTTFTTSRPHNFVPGNQVDITGLDYNLVTNVSMSGGVATLATEKPHNIPVGSSINVNGIPEVRGIASGRLVNGLAELTLTSGPTYAVGSAIEVKGTSDTYGVVTREVLRGMVTLTLAAPHNVLEGSKITVQGLGAPFDGTEIYVESVTTTRVSYKIEQKYWDEKRAAEEAGRPVNVPMNIPESRVSGTLIVPEGQYNGTWSVDSVSGNTLRYRLGGSDQPSRPLSGSVSGDSPVNGNRTVTGRSGNTVQFATVAGNYSSAVPKPVEQDAVLPEIALETIHGGTRTITGVTATTFSFSQNVPSAVSGDVQLYASTDSILNGTYPVRSVPTTDRLTFTLNAGTRSIFEQSSTNLSVLRAEGLYAGERTITEVDEANQTISFSAPGLLDYGTKNVVSRGDIVMMPTAIVSTFGPYPGNADIGLRFQTQGYTGINIEPITYRSFELKSVGDALDAYADNIDGFEYRVDCSYDAAAGQFNRTFVMLPINYPNPPAAGEVSPPERFGAERLTFEYPGGNITQFAIDESAEESATRFFMSGETDLGPDVGPNIGVATDQALLRGDRTGRRWPLLDASGDLEGIDDEVTLYNQARRFLSDSAPPKADLTITVNGSLPPFAGNYAPGDWCTILLEDIFAQERLKSGMEPRQDSFIRKISAIRVNVPDGTTFPEKIDLSLVPEWEIDGNA
ncbi:minor tail protein [Microbacterium phage Cece]|nr:minor tail protein [Microbacterium phage Cece]